MDAQSGRPDPTLKPFPEPPSVGAPSLEQLLFAEPYRFEFFQAVRLLERLLPERLPVGRISEEGQVVAPTREVARFRTRVSLVFPPSQVHDLNAATSEGEPPQMEVAFMGLTGPTGVLPNAYTELLIERLRQKDRALYDFLDLFNHRLISFFYRAWEKYRFPVAYERVPGNDQFTTWLLAIIGLGTRGLRRRLSLRDEALLAYSGLVAQRPHSASAIAAIISDYFSAPTRILQFVGQWLALDATSVTRLGRANSVLGLSTLVGARVWDDQSKFRLQLGPLSYGQFAEFLPVAGAFKPVMELTRLLAGAEFDFDVQLLLKAKEVPDLALITCAPHKPMLGRNTWLKTKDFTADDGQVILAGAA